MFAAQLSSDFTIISSEPGKTVLRVVQDGSPSDGAADEFYAGCEVGRRETFAANTTVPVGVRSRP